MSLLDGFWWRVGLGLAELVMAIGAAVGFLVLLAMVALTVMAWDYLSRRWGRRNS